MKRRKEKKNVREREWKSKLLEEGMLKKRENAEEERDWEREYEVKEWRRERECKQKKKENVKKRVNVSIKEEESNRKGEERERDVAHTKERKEWVREIKV